MPPNSIAYTTRMREIRRYAQPGAEELHGGGAVLMLGTLRLRGHDQARGNVRDTHGGFHFVDVLAAFAAGTEGVHREFIRRDDDVR